MAVNYVQSNQVITHNGVDLTNLNFQTGVVTGQTVNIPTAQQGAFIIDAFWRIPVTLDGILINYQYQQAFTSTKPKPDALKVLRVKYERDSWELAITDSDYVGTTNAFGTLADDLGGALATMPTVSIPFPIIQGRPVTTNTSGTNTFVFAFPQNPLALLYSIPWPWFNGVAPATPYAPTGITTPALFVTWANTNWGMYGTWTSNGNIVTLSSPTSATIPVTRAGVLASLTPASWCLDLTSFSTPAAVNGMQLGTATVIPFGAFMLSSANLQPLINAIQPHFESGAVFAITTTKINITTVSAVLKIYNNTTVKATATTGVCS